MGLSLGHEEAAVKVSQAPGPAERGFWPRPRARSDSNFRSMINYLSMSRETLRTYVYQKSCVFLTFKCLLVSLIVRPAAPTTAATLGQPPSDTWAPRRAGRCPHEPGAGKRGAVGRVWGESLGWGWSWEVTPLPSPPRSPPRSSLASQKHSAGPECLPAFELKVCGDLNGSRADSLIDGEDAHPEIAVCPSAFAHRQAACPVPGNRVGLRLPPSVDTMGMFSCLEWDPSPVRFLAGGCGQKEAPFLYICSVVGHRPAPVPTELAPRSVFLLPSPRAPGRDGPAPSSHAAPAGMALPGRVASPLPPGSGQQTRVLLLGARRFPLYFPGAAAGGGQRTSLRSVHKPVGRMLRASHGTSHVATCWAVTLRGCQAAGPGALVTRAGSGGAPDRRERQQGRSCRLGAPPSGLGPHSPGRGLVSRLCPAPVREVPRRTRCPGGFWAPRTPHRVVGNSCRNRILQPASCRNPLVKSRKPPRPSLSVPCPLWAPGRGMGLRLRDGTRQPHRDAEQKPLGPCSQATSCSGGARGPRPVQDSPLRALPATRLGESWPGDLPLPPECPGVTIPAPPLWAV